AERCLEVLFARWAVALDGFQGWRPEALWHRWHAVQPVCALFEYEANGLCSLYEEILDIFGHQAQVFVELRLAMQAGKVELARRKCEVGRFEKRFGALAGEKLDVVDEVFGAPWVDRRFPQNILQIEPFDSEERADHVEDAVRLKFVSDSFDLLE